MKKFLTVCSTLFVVGFAVAQSLPNSENYIESRTYLDPVNSTSPGAKQIHTVQYMDGLGRPKQIVSVKASPAQKDVVVPVEYDQWGRQVKDYLPVPQSGTQNGQIYTSPLANAPSVYGSEKIYAEKILEQSPLDRILQQKQVGNDWSAHPVVFGYNTNSATEVKKYTTTTTWTDNATISALTVSGTYGVDQLYKNTVTDEDGSISVEFKNGQGQTLLVRKHDGSQNVDTYYVYNEYDHLAFVISPLAALKATLTGADLDHLCYQYRYDGRNRLVEKKLPGKGWEYMVYDKQDRLTASKDVQNEWIFTKYDQFGRVLYTGLSNLGNSRSTVQQSLDNLLGTAASNNETSHSIGFHHSNMLLYYNNTAFPTSFSKILSVNYYDTYPTGTLAIPGTVLTQAVLTQDAQNSSISTKSLPTASYVKNIEDDNWTKTYTWYDTKGRPVGSHSINHLGGYTKTESKLDFAGAVKEAKTFHKRLDSDSETVITENFTYDHQNRLVSQTHQVNSNMPETLVINSYNELSQLNQKELGGGMQTVNYSYNIRGWLTKLNDPSNLNTKLFGYELKYNNPGYISLTTGKFNGNIAEMDWKSSQDGVLRRYTYQFDQLDRFLKANYAEPNSSIPQNVYYNEEVSYDLNGNIQNLKRNRAGYSAAEQIDNLAYIYTGNKLNSVTDSSNNYFGYPDTSGSAILYDYNGNMTKHEDKGILEIAYNHLNLPNYLKFNNFVIRDDMFGGTDTVYENTVFIYRADGVKLAKTHHFFWGRGQTSIHKTTEYVDGFQYAGDPLGVQIVQLQFVPTSEGYFDFTKNKYLYQYKDQVGNTRLTFFKDENGSPAISRISNFYPFGLEFGGARALDTTENGLNSGYVNQNYTYAFQGQERQQETGWDSFKWRNYDPSMGRFFNIDPLTEKYNTWSPYAFSGNRVIDAREIEGLEPHVLFNTRENAAANFGQQYNGKSIIQKREYAALIYVRVVDGKKYYAYNKPEKGEAHGVPQGVSGKAPKGSTPAAWVHTHGNDDYGSAGNYNDQNFSDEDGDKGYSRALGLDAFLVTPDGSLKYYDLSSGTEKPLRTDMPSDPNNEDPRKNNIDPTLNPNPSSGDYRPKPKIFPDLDPSTNNSIKPPVKDGGIKAIDDRRREEINRMGPPIHR